MRRRAERQGHPVPPPPGPNRRPSPPPPRAGGYQEASAGRPRQQQEAQRPGRRRKALARRSPLPLKGARRRPAAGRGVTAQAGRSPEQHAGTEVRVLQRVGLHLRVHRQHLAGQDGRWPGWRCSGVGAAPAAPGSVGWDAGPEAAARIRARGAREPLASGSRALVALRVPASQAAPPPGAAWRKPAMRCCRIPGSLELQAACGGGGTKGWPRGRSRERGEGVRQGRRRLWIEAGRPSAGNTGLRA